MKVLLAHNRYRHPGGEDEVFRRESALLRSAGHDVVEYVRHNGEISTDGIASAFKAATQTLWNWESARHLRSVLRQEKPQLAHFHNTFPLISPAAYYACKEYGVPVVQSLHNPRLMCPAATLCREGRSCEACTSKPLAWPGVVHGCYRDSRSQTAVVTGMLALHRFLRTWQKQIDAYIVFTDFFREKFLAAGLPPERIFVKPHFLDADPGMKHTRGDYALYVGRLTAAKGVLTMLEAWRNLKHIPLRIVGEGTLENKVHAFKQDHALVSTSRRVSPAESLALIKGARFLLWPSEGYAETFGLVLIEAFACGTPVITSASGAMKELVEDTKTGLYFEPGNAKDLAGKVDWAWNHPQEMDEIGRLGRAEYLRKYTALGNHETLMRIYRSAIDHSRSRQSGLRIFCPSPQGHQA